MVMENIIMATFPVESEAYQAFSELKRDLSGMSFLVSQAVLVKKENGTLNTLDAFDTGIDTSDDTLGGTMIGSIVGILGGPFGVLLGAGIGSLIGAAVDAGDIAQNGSSLEKVSAGMKDGSVAILALAQEDNRAPIDSKFDKFNSTVTRYDAAEVEAEVEAATEAQREMAKKARVAVRQEKNAAYKAKLEEKRAKIAGDFETLKNKRKK